jgi:hypothetical protein
MRFSTITALALPVLAVSAIEQESPLDQFKIQAQFYLDKVAAWIPSPNKAHTEQPGDVAPKSSGGKTLEILTLDNWDTTLYSKVPSASNKPEQWWVLVTGGNKTCFGHCGRVEAAFNETASIMAKSKDSPSMALLNCDNQPVLCNAWAAGPPNIYVFDILPKPAPVDVRVIHLNSTTVTVEDIVKLSSTFKDQPVYEGYFHPFDGPLAKYGVAVPLAWVLWVFSVVPSWLFMIGVSMLSRNIM